MDKIIVNGSDVPILSAPYQNPDHGRSPVLQIA